jgi:hypothetical protein
MSDFINAVIQSGPNEGKTIGECIMANHVPTTRDAINEQLTSKQLYWLPTSETEHGHHQVCLYQGAIVGYVEQFPENTPTTYATAYGSRIGPFSSWDDAKQAVETRIAKSGWARPVDRSSQPCPR